MVRLKHSALQGKCFAIRDTAEICKPGRLSSVHNMTLPETKKLTYSVFSLDSGSRIADLKTPSSQS